jgi:hypothetical protein
MSSEEVCHPTLTNRGDICDVQYYGSLIVDSSDITTA